MTVAETTDFTFWLQWIEERGFVVLPDVFSANTIDHLSTQLGRVLQVEANGAISTTSGLVYASRNVQDLWPEVDTVWRHEPLPSMLQQILGPDFGLVRALFFDKPPEHTWALPWHKDLTIAVHDNTLPSTQFRKPTRKAGVPHVEAPEAVLRSMLTVRVHLDAATEANGPLKVLPGSHHTGKELILDRYTPTSILSDAGAVLLMRPLLVHSSGRSHPEVDMHRRVLHLEFAGSPGLPDGYRWQTFFPGIRI